MINFKYIVLFLLAILQINIFAQKGCTDPLANNYNTNAKDNDGSCKYPQTSISFEKSWDLNSTLKETSGLIEWQDKIWTMNDDLDKFIYGFDTNNLTPTKTYNLGISNKEWEEISQDDFFIYMGDFGNNSAGNRSDLRIYKINKQALTNGNFSVDTIQFSYNLQTNSSPQSANTTDFDCEAFIVTKDSIFLFTKEWTSMKTSIYSLPKTKGKFVAQYKNSININGLITGATYIENKKLIVLCGYSKILEPFVFLIYDFKGSNFISGNKRKITIEAPIHQIEGITTQNGINYFLTNEYFSQSFITSKNRLHFLNLGSFLANYLMKQNTDISETKNIKTSFYPNPSADFITFLNTCSDTIYIYDSQGKLIEKQNINSHEMLNIKALIPGIYYLKNKEKTFKLIKQ